MCRRTASNGYFTFHQDLVYSYIFAFKCRIGTETVKFLPFSLCMLASTCMYIHRWYWNGGKYPVWMVPHKRLFLSTATNHRLNLLLINISDKAIWTKPEIMTWEITGSVWWMTAVVRASLHSISFSSNESKVGYHIKEGLRPGGNLSRKSLFSVMPFPPFSKAGAGPFKQQDIIFGSNVTRWWFTMGEKLKRVWCK